GLRPGAVSLVPGPGKTGPGPRLSSAVSTSNPQPPGTPPPQSDAENQMRACGEEEELAVERQTEESRIRGGEKQCFHDERPGDRAPEEQPARSGRNHGKEHDAQ